MLNFVRNVRRSLGAKLALAVSGVLFLTLSGSTTRPGGSRPSGAGVHQPFGQRQGRLTGKTADIEYEKHHTSG
jgi:hypothetical protein